MFYLGVNLIVDVAAFAILVNGDADPLVAWTIVILLIALNIVGVLTFAEVEGIWMNDRKDGK